MSARPARFDQPSALLPTAAPARAARWAAQLLLVLALAAVLFCTLVPLPQAVMVPFEMVPVEAADDVQAPISGELLKIAIAEGETVVAGQLLFELKNSDISSRQSQLRQLREQKLALEASSARAEQAFDAANAISRGELGSAERELGFRGDAVSAQRDLVDRAERLARSGVVAEVDLLKYRLSLLEAEKDRSNSARSVEQLRLTAQQRSAERERLRGQEESSLRLLAERIATAEFELADSQGDRRLIRAAYAGVVLRLPARTPGSVVAAGETLAQFARADGGLKARLQLSDAALPRLQLGQNVRLQLDAFPYQRYGSVDAQLSWISPAALEFGGSRGFIAETGMPESELMLQPGMRGQARIIIDRRTLLQRGLEPLRAARERLR